MKIIKEGKWKEVWSKEYVCTTCEAVLLVEESDVKPLDGTLHFYCLCPLCAKRVDIKADDLSVRVREEVGKRRTRWSCGDVR